MFTGLVTNIGTIVSAEQRGDLRLRIRCGYDMAGVELGASIACSGVCLTVVDKGEDWFAVDVSTETLSRTAAAHWRQGARLNLERPLRVGDELGGHFVTGHIDCVGSIASVTPEGGSTRLDISVAGEFAQLLAAKGSVAVDGVSLTVNDVEEDDGGVRFSVNIIPHTAAHTTLGAAEAGGQFNVEFDVLARYIARMVAAHAQ